MIQILIGPRDDYRGVDEWVGRNGCKRILAVCDGSIRFLPDIRKKLSGLAAPVIFFSGFRPNPLYENVLEGVRLFRSEGCDGILAVGGGSAMDVAKCIKLYAALPGDGADGAWLRSGAAPAPVSFLAMPTTAGTGSEATRYAVIYYRGEKQSITCDALIPDTVLMDPGALRSLPDYQRKATMADALCHGIESFWSVNSSDESLAYSREAIEGVLAHMEGYLSNTEAGNAGMLRAAYTAGKAINITQTTAGHAMCYKITGLFGCAHGHAALLCDRALYPWMVCNTDRCIDPRGRAYLEKTLDGIGQALGCADGAQGAEKLQRIFEGLGLEIPRADQGQFVLLRGSVNPVRLRNHPAALDREALDMLYHRILGEARGA